MRITNNMIVANTIKNINNAANRMNEAEERVSSEKKISLPSDDPVVATRAIKYRNYVDTIEQYQTNVSDVQSWQSVTDDALSSLSDVITQTRTLVAKASSATMTDSDLSDIATEISELEDQAVDIMNTTYGGRYIFGGYDTDTAPYALVQGSAVSAFTAGTGNYTAASLSLSGELTAGDNYTIGVTESSGTYTVTMKDASNNTVATGTTTSSTGSVSLTTTSGGTITLSAPAGGYTTGDGFTFSIANDIDQVTYKGEYLTTTYSSSLSAATMAGVYTATGVYSSTSAQSIKYNIGYGSDITVNTEGQDVVGSSTGTSLFDTFSKVLLALNGDTSYETYDSATGTSTATSISDIDALLTDLDNNVDMLTTAQAALGASESHVSNVSDRLSSDYTTYTGLMSNNEDVDTAKATIEESSAETVYDASLSVGAKAISKTLVDYMA